jgi:WD40 repeat protein
MSTEPAFILTRFEPRCRVRAPLDDCGPSSASERRVAAGCTNGELIVWDTATGRELRVIRGHTSNVRSGGLESRRPADR